MIFMFMFTVYYLNTIPVVVHHVMSHDDNYVYYNYYTAFAYYKSTYIKQYMHMVVLTGHMCIC